jgi:hypothetical protein
MGDQYATPKTRWVRSSAYSGMGSNSITLLLELTLFFIAQTICANHYQRRMTMNKHVELVKKWLADPSSVTLKELEKNRDAAAAAYDAADAYYAAAADAAYYADDAAADWVKRYEDLENDK